MPDIHWDPTDLSFSVAGLNPDTFQLLSLEGVEQLGHPFRFELMLSAGCDAVVAEDLPGKRGELVLKSGSVVRPRRGVVEEVELIKRGRHRAWFRVILVPTIGLARHQIRSRIFQGVDVPGLVEKVLGHRPEVPRVRRKLQRAYGKRDFCVQYQESDLAFALRLMEEEGIASYFDHGPEPEVLVITDDRPGGLEEIPEGLLPYRGEFSAALFGTLAVWGFGVTSQVAAGSVVLRDYRPQQPAIGLEGRAQGKRFSQLEFYEYPGEFTTQAMGAGLARVRLEELSAGLDVYQGETNCPLLEPGRTFHLTGHPIPTYNREWLVVRVGHQGAEAASVWGELLEKVDVERGYRASFRCIPVEVPYRPPRVTPRPRIMGVQPAVVVGPRHEEVFCDAQGRVKVQFHWDRQGKRDEHSACWVRVSQPWAGASYGAYFLPRVGQEVLVQFLEGDPDRPIITGRVFNGEHPMPYALPKHKTRSGVKTRSSPGGKGFNELRFEDAAGAEEVYLRAQRDLREEVLHCHAYQVGLDQSGLVEQDRGHQTGRDDRLSVGQDRLETVGRHRVSRVGGDLREEVVGNRDREVAGDEQVLVVGNRVEVVEKGDLALAVRKGTRTQTIGHGSDQLFVSGDWLVRVGKGDHQLSIDQGGRQTAIKGADGLQVGESLTIHADQHIGLDASQDVRVQAGERLEVQAGSSTLVVGGGELHGKAADIRLEGKASLTLKCGPSELVLTPAGISIKAAQISSDATGIHSITGLIVRIN